MFIVFARLWHKEKHRVNQVQSYLRPLDCAVGCLEVKVFVGNQNFCLSLTPLGARKRIKSFD